MPDQNSSLREPSTSTPNPRSHEQHLVWIDKNWYLPVDGLSTKIMFKFPSSRWLEIKNKYAQLFLTSSW